MMSRNPFKSAIGRCLNEATESLEVFESLPKRHALRDRSEVITPIEVDHDLGGHDATDVPLGSFTATVPAWDFAPLRSLCAQLEHTDAPVHGLAEVSASMRSVEEFRAQYLQGAFASLSMSRFAEAVGALATKARQTLDAADQACKEWLAVPVSTDENVGVRIGEEWYLTAAHIAARSGSTVDAARKLLREMGIPIHRFGRVMHVRLQDFLDATREAPAGTQS
jgi:hypothetical protein